LTIKQHQTHQTTTRLFLFDIYFTPHSPRGLNNALSPPTCNTHTQNEVTPWQFHTLAISHLQDLSCLTFVLIPFAHFQQQPLGFAHSKLSGIFSSAAAGYANTESQLNVRFPS
jgi:hypothetical protein